MFMYLEKLSKAQESYKCVKKTIKERRSSTWKLLKELSLSAWFANWKYSYIFLQTFFLGGVPGQ